MKRALAILILMTAALGVAACNNGSGTSAEPTLSVESPLASEMPADSEEASSTP